MNQRLDRKALHTGISQIASEVPHEVFIRWRAGDDHALSELLPLIYQELRGVAHERLRGQRADHTLQTTALIHEAHLRLAGGATINLDRVHFVSLASRITRGCWSTTHAPDS